MFAAVEETFYDQKLFIEFDRLQTFSVDKETMNLIVSEKFICL